jgi:hypothetical protein
MAIKLDLSENLTSYKSDLEKGLSTLETEINSISISLSAIPKSQILNIENIITESQNNVN